MVEREDYYFFAINPDQTIASFRSKFETSDLVGLKTNLASFKQVTCLPDQYERAVEAFRKNPDPAGEVLEWVCRDNRDYLDLTEHRMELTPRY